MRLVGGRSTLEPTSLSPLCCTFGLRGPAQGSEFGFVGTFAQPPLSWASYVTVESTCNEEVAFELVLETGTDRGLRLTVIGMEHLLRSTTVPPPAPLRAALSPKKPAAITQGMLPMPPT